MCGNIAIWLPGGPSNQSRTGTEPSISYVGLVAAAYVRSRHFFAPALGSAVLAASMAKLLWRQELAGVPWHRLAIWAALAGMAVLIGGLVLFGRDGKMATYAALVIVTALALWVAGFVRR